MTTALEFPFQITKPRRLLMAPLRAEVVRCEQAVQKALALLTAIDGCEIGMFQDAVVCCIEGAPNFSSLAIAQDAERVVRQAIRRDRKQGYDTWRARDLDRLITAGGRLSATLRALHAARRELITAEATEIKRQKEATA